MNVGTRHSALIHRQRLAQVARKVRVIAARHAELIRQQLQRQDGQQWVQDRPGLRQHDQVMGVGAQAGVLFADDDGVRRRGTSSR